MSSESSREQGPLNGLHVLDFSNFIAGCYAAQLLGDMGARVIKVETLLGDGARSWGPFLAGESRFFQGWNRNKRGIAVDLLSDKGKEIVARLVNKADIVVENFRPGVTKKLGIDYDTLKGLNPGLIYCSITAFGTKGPYGTRPGYDPILQAMSGTARANVRFSDSVSISSVAVADYGAGMLGCSGILAALFHRERTGEGQRVETSLLQSIMSVQSHAFCQALEKEEEPPFGIFPYSFFDTKDDIIFVCGPTNKFWKIFCEAIGAPELCSGPKYDSNPKRVENADELREKLRPFLLEKTTAEWMEIFLKQGLPSGPAQTYEEFFDDPQVKAMDMNPTLEHPLIGPIRVAGVPLHFEKTPGAIQFTAPTLGQHTDDVLSEIGYNANEIRELRSSDAVR